MGQEQQKFFLGHSSQLTSCGRVIPDEVEWNVVFDPDYFTNRQLPPPKWFVDWHQKVTSLNTPTNGLRRNLIRLATRIQDILMYPPTSHKPEQTPTSESTPINQIKLRRGLDAIRIANSSNIPEFTTPPAVTVGQARQELRKQAALKSHNIRYRTFIAFASIFIDREDGLG